jgi:ribonucleoside-diphosphate reductase alpha chain
VAQKAGIGLNVGRLRALNSQVRGGEISHTGLIPYIQMFEKVVHSCCVTPETWVEILDEDN